MLKERLKTRVKPLIAAIVNRQLTIRAAALQLGVTESYLSKVLISLNVERITAPTRQQVKELNAQRKAHRTHLANTLPPKEAAKAANCTLRTIYRYRK
jgi:transposase-like protein